MKTDTYHYFSLPATDKAAIAELSHHYWPNVEDADENDLRYYLEQQIVVVMHDKNGQLAGSLKIPTTSVTLNDQRYQVSGLSEVMIAPQYLHKGFGTSLIMTAFALIQHDDADFSIFTCPPDLVPFYELGGWTTSPQTVLIGGSSSNPIKSDNIGTVSMLSCFTPVALDHQEQIANSTIALNVGPNVMW
ncbi:MULTISPECIES: GNAT family N-acetyltransferase [Furfurilactobacillus]|uniref:GNAT family N-acetyltransferase n=2 Tax=Furfurilactobacillus TaxID=2767882 RepID=A0A6N9I4D4_9LACO|nr:GNAT family N-acetyltransferase [Furfurilactobacillus milii]MYV06082.1 GNAT family N-acetyltransferase [Furfurilactobacillus milii]MYV17758.1 GNAT family N-acetyltransferase [Furfurilactobacillus milii]